MKDGDISSRVIQTIDADQLQIETSLSPVELLNRLQAIEQGHGRVKLIDKGPRNIDLDIAIFRDEIVDSERLTVPHMLMHEREFVLRPMFEYVPVGYPLDIARMLTDFVASTVFIFGKTHVPESLYIRCTRDSGRLHETTCTRQRRSLQGIPCTPRFPRAKRRSCQY